MSVDLDDAVVVEEVDQPRDEAPVVAAELVLRPTREALTPIDPEQVIASMKAYQDLLPRLLEPGDFQDAGAGKRFVKRSGWRKIARAFNLSLTLIDRSVDRDEQGNAIRAEVVVRAIAPNGQMQDGDGYCSIDEPRFKDARGRQRIEQDLRATATTRAKSRAISDLIGMGDLSDEDAASDEASPELTAAAMDAIAAVLAGDQDLVAHTANRLNQHFAGKVTTPVAQAIVILGQSIDRQRAQPS